MNAAELKKEFCRSFCDGLSVSTVPVGFAVSTAFRLPDGDALDFFVTETPDGFVLEDDGSFLSHAIASGIPLDTGARRGLLDGILSESEAYWDTETYQLKSNPVPASEIREASLRFTSALVRSRDLLLLTQETVANTFAEDLRATLETRLREFDVMDNDPSDNPADFVLRYKRSGLRAASVYAANSNEKLMAALLRHTERKDDDAPVIAVIDKEPGKSVSQRRFVMAQNRGLLMPFFSDPNGVVHYIESHVKADAA